MPLINYLTRIHFADAVLEEALAAEIEGLKLRRPMIVTDRVLSETDLLGRLVSGIPEKCSHTLYVTETGWPRVEACESAAAAYRAEACDGVIGFGGGSVIDFAKAVALRASHEGPLCQYAAGEGGITRIRDVLPPLIAIPTTAGPGSEVVGATAIVPGGDACLVLMSPFLVPDAAICDPTLTIGLPAHLTAGTGMDALSHCIETFIATAYNPPADGIALDGVGRAAANIERAVDCGDDLDARREMMAAALNGALALQKGLGAVRAVSNALGAISGYRLHHGTLNAVLLPHVLAYNAPAVGDRYEPIVRCARLASEGSHLIDALSRLAQSLGLPSTLGELGIGPESIAPAAQLAERDHATRTNPRRVNAADYERLMRAAL